MSDIAALMAALAVHEGVNSTSLPGCICFAVRPMAAVAPCVIPKGS